MEKAYKYTNLRQTNDTNTIVVFTDVLSCTDCALWEGFSEIVTMNLFMPAYNKYNTAVLYIFYSSFWDNELKVCVFRIITSQNVGEGGGNTLSIICTMDQV